MTELAASERAVVRLLQGSLPPVPGLFVNAADALHVPVERLLELLRGWRARGILRRVALVVRHGSVGFKANSMCVWHVPAAEMGAAGRRLAACPEVPHCYEREAVPEFPYNLYAMIHAADWAGVRGLFAEVAGAAGMHAGRMLCSLREFKKSSMQYFADEEHRA